MVEVREVREGTVRQTFKKKKTEREKQGDHAAPLGEVSLHDRSPVFKFGVICYTTAYKNNILS